MTNVQDEILGHLRRRSCGKVYTSKDLAHLGSRAAVDQVLSRLARDGTLQRLARGLYYYPRTNARLGIAVSPNADEIAAALARQTGSQIAPSAHLRQTGSDYPPRSPPSMSTLRMDGPARFALETRSLP